MRCSQVLFAGVVKRKDEQLVSCRPCIEGEALSRLSKSLGGVGEDQPKKANVPGDGPELKGSLHQEKKAAVKKRGYAPTMSKETLNNRVKGAS